MPEDKQELFAAAYMGDQAEKFFKTDLGEYLLTRVDDIIETERRKLEEEDPSKREAIQKIQNEIWRARKFQSWLGELIIDGQQARELIEIEEE